MMKVEKELLIAYFADERSIHTRRWVNGMRQIGHTVELITLIKDPRNDIGGISLGSGGKLSYLTKVGKLRKHVRKIGPDILHTHHASSFGFLSSFVSHPRKILSVWGYDIIDFPRNNPFKMLMIKRALGKSNYITATSKFLEKTALKIKPELKNIRVVPFGVDIDMFSYVQRERKKTVRIGIAKSLYPKYGIDILIEAFALLCKKHDNILLSIAGKGAWENQYKELAKKSGLSDKIEFNGYIPHDKLPEFLGKLDIFAMPSILDGESFGVAAIEAAATGLPVVATTVGGVPEVVIQNQSGILVNRGDISGLAEALDALIENHELRVEMGKAGRKIVEDKYIWDINLRTMNDLYMEAIK